LTAFELAEWSTFFKMEKEAHDDAMRKAQLKKRR